MLLRIEDTDQKRFVPGAEEYISEALEWIGIKIDEGTQIGGPHAPYRQSERKHIYRQYAEKLIADGNAYYAFDTDQELEEMRKRLEAAKVVAPSYNSITRMQMKNSLTLPDDEVKRKLAAGEPYVIRLKVPRKEEIRLHDLVRGWVMVHSSSIDDKVLMKSDGMPTYHLANVVDDHLMQITHVIRGEEWLPSAPLHVLLYKFLGWEESMPQFAHLPLLLKPDGNGKLSKRDADAGGFPVFPLDWKDPQTGEIYMGFREQGYLPEAITNFLALLGWNPGTEQELFTMDELIENFSIERISKAGAKFDINKAKWFNQQYLRKIPDTELAQTLKKQLEEKKIPHSSYNMEKIVSLIKERIVFHSDVWKEALFFFIAPQQFDPESVRTKWSSEAANIIAEFKKALNNLTDIKAENIKTILHQTAESSGLKIGKVLPALRLAITGAIAGPDLMAIIEILGKDETIARINYALQNINHKIPT